MKSTLNLKATYRNGEILGLHQQHPFRHLNRRPCHRRDDPERLRKLSSYCLFRELHGYRIAGIFDQGCWRFVSF